MVYSTRSFTRYVGSRMESWFVAFAQWKLHSIQDGKSPLGHGHCMMAWWNHNSVKNGDRGTFYEFIFPWIDPAQDQTLQTLINQEVRTCTGVDSLQL